MAQFENAEALIAREAPLGPVLCVRPHAARRAANWFQENFPGEIVYALKANDAPLILRALSEAGIARFDVASVAEIETAARLARSELFFMNPVKPREAIARAYSDFGVRTFALDTQSELDKITRATGGARDLKLFVRLACSNRHSLIPLEGKFGAHGEAASQLLVAARQASEQLGVTFHVGSQAMTPQGFGEAMALAGEMIRAAGVMIDAIDVGGGFPSRYGGAEPPALEAYMSAIAEGAERLAVGEACQLLCEPGRALVAEAESLLLRVEARRERDLYVNDGAFGTLYDAAYSGFAYPARLVRSKGSAALGEAEPFRLMGPTCDSVDIMPGPYWLPGCIGEGDYIEIGQVGAYGRVLASSFNGFGRYQEAVLLDEPMATMYGSDEAVSAPDQRLAQ